MLTKRITALLLAAILLLSVAACGAKGAWQEQYDLGMRCLNEGNYQEAVIAFEAAIEIDPKRPEAYLGAAEAYIAADDIDAAIAILEKGYAVTNDETLKNRLDEIKSGTFSDYWGRAKQLSGYDENGALVWYHLYTYDAQGREDSATSYDAAGNQTSHVDCVYDENGRQLIGYVWTSEAGSLVEVERTYDSNGHIIKKVIPYSENDVRTSIYQYDESGNCIRWDDYFGDGNLAFYALYEYNAAGQESKILYYEPDGTLESYDAYFYDDAGTLTEQHNCSGDGQLLWRSVYYHDPDGHRTDIKSYDSEGNLQSSTSYQN